MFQSLARDVQGASVQLVHLFLVKYQSSDWLAHESWIKIKEIQVKTSFI